LDCNEKNGKTYFHFWNGTRATAVAIKNYPNLPQKVRLLNTGAELSFAAEVLPDYFNGKTGIAEQVYLHIRGIPVDDLGSEPIILEVQW